MLLKNVKKLFSKPTSITARLTLLYAVSTILLLAVVSLLSYWAMFNIVYYADKEFLSDRVDALQENLANNPKSKALLKSQIIDIPNALSDSMYHYFIRVVNKNNNEIISTPGMRLIVKKYHLSFFPAVKTFRWQTIDDKTYLILESQIKTGKNNLYAQAVLDVSYQYQLIKEYRNGEYRNQIFLIFMVSIIAAIILGYFIAKRAMRRLHDLTENTRRITATSLHNRIDPMSWPTELRDLGVSFNLMLDRIERSFLRLTQFSDDLAHELRTPINNLMGETEVALSRTGGVAELHDVLGSNLEELQRISQIIENLLFLARSENPQFEIKKEIIHVENEINIIKEYYQALADDKNITINSEGTALVSAEPVMFRRMLNNLLSNAIKYSENNGNVKITVKNINSSMVELTVEDNGVGIPAEHQPNLYNRFYRVDSNRSQKLGGIGLGLAIVKSIVDLHNGSISIVSQSNRGTLVKVILPGALSS